MAQKSKKEWVKKFIRALFINEFTVFVFVFLPIVVSLVLLAVLSAFALRNAWGYGFAAILLGILVEFPYAKLCDRFLK